MRITTPLAGVPATFLSLSHVALAISVDLNSFGMYPFRRITILPSCDSPPETLRDEGYLNAC
jgi:hypothetical protein